MIAEEAILSCMLNDIVIAKEACSRLLSSDFTDDRNRRIFKSIQKNIDDGAVPELITVTRYCKDLAVYITELSSKLSSTANYQEYISIIIEEAGLRRLQTNAINVAALYSADEVIEYLSTSIEYVQGRLAGTEDYSTSNTVLKSLVALEERVVGKNPGITTPVPKLTSYTGGWQPSDLIIIAARPSMGKTAFALACVQKAVEEDKAVVFFSLEMARERLMDRLIVGHADVDARNYKFGKLSEEDRIKVYNSAEYFKTRQITINDRGSIGLAEIEAFATARKKEGKCDIIIVDYIQLMKVRHDKNKTRDGELSEISRGMKLMARDMNIPVIVLSQLNRQVEQRANKRPMISDLRESGAIEQDADIVLLLYRAAYYNEEIIEVKGEKVASKGIGEVTIGKHRNGEIGTEYFAHNDSMTRIYPYRSQYEIDLTTANYNHEPNSEF